MNRGCERELGSEAVYAAILETDDPERVYTALSFVVSAASEGEPARVLLGFGGLAALDGERRAGAHVAHEEREAFAHTLDALWETALEICDVWACSAAAQAVGADTSRLAGVISMPQFVREVSGARLIVI